MCKITLEHIRQSNLIEGIDSKEADQDSLFAWTYLHQQEVVTMEVLLELHRLITYKQLDNYEAGHIRRVMVRVGDHIAPNPLDILPMLKTWLHELENDDHPIGPRQMHVDFETIHPFVDGNGRTGRMLMWWHEIKKLNKEPTMIKASERQDYYKWFREGRQ